MTNKQNSRDELYHGTESARRRPAAPQSLSGGQLAEPAGTSAVQSDLLSLVKALPAMFVPHQHQTGAAVDPGLQMDAVALLRKHLMALQQRNSDNTAAVAGGFAERRPYRQSENKTMTGINGSDARYIENSTTTLSPLPYLAQLLASPAEKRGEDDAKAGERLLEWLQKRLQGISTLLTYIIWGFIVPV